MGRRSKKSSKRTPKTPFEAVDKTEWEVEAIHAKRWAKGVLQYEVKWKDHVDKDNTWEPLENLVGAELSISDFEDAWEKNYNAPRKEKRTRQTATSCATPLEEAQSEADESLDSTIRQAVDLAETLSAGEPYALSLCLSQSFIPICLLQLGTSRLHLPLLLDQLCTKPSPEPCMKANPYGCVT